MLQTKQRFAETKGVSVLILNNWICTMAYKLFRSGRTYVDKDDFTVWLAEHRKVTSQKICKVATSCGIQTVNVGKAT